MNGDLAAIDRIIKLMERRSKLLGLDAQPAEPVGAAELRIVVEDSAEGWDWLRPKVRVT